MNLNGKTAMLLLRERTTNTLMPVFVGANTIIVCFTSKPVVTVTIETNSLKYEVLNCETFHINQERLGTYHSNIFATQKNKQENNEVCKTLISTTHLIFLAKVFMLLLS
jgi:hypothetical protein